MDCFHDFCLFCDRDSPDGPYCSQRCKLADLERANNSNPTSPTSPTSHRSSYKLEPAYNFQQSTSNYEATSSSRPRSSYFSWSQQDRAALDERQLTPSSSRTSLSSTTSTGSQAGMSSHAKQQLQEYFSSFDQAKAAKRRSSTR